MALGSAIIVRDVIANIPASSSGGIGRIFISTDENTMYRDNGTSWDEILIDGSILNKFDATTAPTTGDDTGDGYTVGSLWVDVTNDKAYIALDVTASSAVWVDITQSGGGTPNYPASSVALSSDVLVVGSNRFITVQAETGTADNLVEITGLSIGDSVMLVADAGDTITVKHNSGSATIKILIQDDADFVLDEIHPLHLVLKSATELVQVYDETSSGGSSPTEAAYLVKQSSQSISNATETAVTFATSSEIYDTDTMHDTSTNNNRITFNTAGKYVVSAGIRWAANGTGRRWVYINDGTNEYVRNVVNATTTNETVQNVTFQASFSASDYIQIAVFQNSGGSLDVQTTNDNTFFSAHRLSD